MADIDDNASAAEQRILIFAPSGRDAPLTAELLDRAGIRGVPCADIASLCACAKEGAAALMIAEETLTPGAVAAIERTLREQPAWSDLPVIVFASPADSGRRALAAELFAPLGNVVFLDRPVRRITMISAARAALRARDRQYASRAALLEQKDAVRSRDEFLAMLGHELRNPLSAIRMAIEMLERNEGDRARLQAILSRQSTHLARLVDDLLDVSRVTSGKIVMRRDHVELRELVRRCVQSLEGAWRAQELDVEVAVPECEIFVEGDAVRIEQVLVNLVNNAIKYTHKGGHVRLSLSAEGGDALIEVKDDGAGIPREMLPRVFDLFAQAAGTIDRAKGGLGIGLTLVRSIVERLGGSVMAESEGVGCGATFTVRLPLSSVAQTTFLRAEPARASDKAKRAILIVEDNADSRETLRLLLHADGHYVDATDDGLAAVRRAIDRPPQVMIIDIGLPGIDGYEVARRVRSSLGCNVFLIALTGYGQPEDRRRAFEAGFDVHFTKPVDPNTLGRLLGGRELNSLLA